MKRHFLQKKKSFSRENRTRMNFPSLLCSFHGKVEQGRVDYVWTCNTLKLHLMDEVMVNNCELWKYPCIIRMKNDAGWRETERSWNSLIPLARRRLVARAESDWAWSIRHRLLAPLDIGEEEGGKSLRKFYLILDSLHSRSRFYFQQFSSEANLVQKRFGISICSLK